MHNSSRSSVLRSSRSDIVIVLPRRRRNRPHPIQMPDSDGPTSPAAAQYHATPPSRSSRRTTPHKSRSEMLDLSRDQIAPVRRTKSGDAMHISTAYDDQSMSDGGDCRSDSSSYSKANNLPFRVCRVFYRLFLPVALLSGCIFRYNFVSFLYLVLLLVAPCVPGYFQVQQADCPKLTHSSRAMVYILLSILTALITMVMQIGFNIFLLSMHG